MWYPELYRKHNNVDRDTAMHKLLNDEAVRAVWIHTILKSRKYKSEKDFPKKYYICWIHFCDGKLTKDDPVSTLFLIMFSKSY